MSLLVQNNLMNGEQNIGIRVIHVFPYVLIVHVSLHIFCIRFNLDIDDADEKNKLISQLHKILRPFMLRRLKVDVEKSLPPKTETILFTGMSAMQKKLYRDILMRDIDTLTGKSAVGGGGGSRTAVLNIVMQLRKCAGHPYLFPGVEDRSLPALGEHLVENCGKMVLLDKLLLRLQERGHRVLLFTQMTKILDILEDYMVRVASVLRRSPTISTYSYLLSAHPRISILPY